LLVKGSDIKMNPCCPKCGSVMDEDDVLGGFVCDKCEVVIPEYLIGEIEASDI